MRQQQRADVPYPPTEEGSTLTPNQSTDSLYSGASSASQMNHNNMQAAGESSSFSSDKLNQASSSVDSRTPFNIEAGEGGGAEYQHPGFFSKAGRYLASKRHGGNDRPQKWYDTLPFNPKNMSRRRIALCLMAMAVLLIILIVLVSVAAKKSVNDNLELGGGKCDQIIIPLYLL